jgi:hypothetical protein
VSGDGRVSLADQVTTGRPERRGEVAAIAAAPRATGGHLVLARDSLVIAKDAARLGLIAEEVRARGGAV